eukprot:458932_1
MIGNNFTSTFETNEALFKTSANFYTSTFTPQSEPFDVSDGHKALSILALLFTIILVAICCYWLFVFWKHRHMRAYKMSLKIRRPIIMIVSYAAILLMLLQQNIRTVYYYFLTDIYISDAFSNVQNDIDIFFRFTFYASLCILFQSKIFRLWILRYTYDYNKEMSNIEWKDHLGLRTVEPTSMFIRYRRFAASIRLIIFCHFFIIIIIMVIQINVSIIIQQTIMIIIFVTQIIYMKWIGTVLTKINDHFFVIMEFKRTVVIHFIFIFIWIIGLILFAQIESIIIAPIGAPFLCTIYVCTLCYSETIRLLKDIDKDWTKLNQPINKNFVHLKLKDILKNQDGFEATMRFLVGEFSCENLLCFVELSQYLHAWGIYDPVMQTQEKSRMRCEMMITGYLREGCTERYKCNPLLYDMLIFPDDLIAMVIAYYYRLYFGDNQYAKEQIGNNNLMKILDRKDNTNTLEATQFLIEMANVDLTQHIHRKDDNNQIDSILEELDFDYFQNPEFNDQFSHWEYINQKYIYDSCCLQINISGALRVEAQNNDNVKGDMVTGEMYSVAKRVLSELWSLMEDSYTRFMDTTEYSKLLDGF